MVGIFFHEIAFFGEKRRLWKFFTLLCRVNSMNRYSDSTPAFFRPAFYQVRPAIIEHVAEPGIGFWKKNGFNQAGVIFKSYEFHGIALSCLYGFARDQPAGKGDFPVGVLRDIPCPDRVRVTGKRREKDHGVMAA